MQMTTLVTAATGKAGRHVVDQLLQRGQTVRALTRDPANARLPAGVEVVGGDLTVPDSLVPAVEGVDAVHLIVDGDHETLRTGPQIAELLERAGVRRVSILWNGSPGPVEEAIAARDLAWTRLEANDFMANALAWADEIRGDGVVQAAYADVPVAIVHEADVGAVAAAVLTSDGHAGKTYVVSGPQPLTVRERIATIAVALGREVTLDELTDAQARERWRAAGHSEQLIELLASWHSDPPPAARAAVDTVERVTGRPPRTFAQWAQEHAAAFRDRSSAVR
jgi:uncharacterized protein YbjT (DUF2867 family)